jgi:hypothetical protein
MLERGAAAVDAGLKVSDRFGEHAIARWLEFERIHIAYWRGRWSECTKLIDEMLSDIGPTHALSRWLFEVRGRICLASDDVGGAVEDSQRSLELGRLAKDLQTFLPAVSFAALASLRAGRRNDAERLANELLGLRVVEHLVPHYSYLSDLAWVLTDLGRIEELTEAAANAPVRTPWIDAIEALARGDYRRAADVYAEAGNRPDEAYTRLRTAAQLVDEGRRAEADKELQQALLFWRSVGAKRYIREGEALLAATA